jgi:hypothetical protein
MSKQICPYCKGSKIEERYYPFVGDSIGRVEKCVRCDGKGKINFRFDTIAEANDWQKEHPCGLYRENAVWWVSVTKIYYSISNQIKLEYTVKICMI